jgi:catechol 2,3-dioxygenase-like lactoylglutathione lyase family enzyme
LADSFKTLTRPPGRVVGMEQRLSVISLGIRDLAAAYRFYVDGLGWTPALEVAGEVIFLQMGHGLLLSLWALEEMATEAGEVYRGEAAAPITLAHNVGSEDEVRAVLDTATAAGGTIIVPAAKRVWGGVSGYFADPDGYRWEVAYNPGLTFGPDGKASFNA